MRARIVGFVAIKGGVGKTSTVANLGSILARDFQKKILVVDANFSGPNLGLHFGFVKPPHTVHDILAGNVPIKKAIYEHFSGLHLLPGALLSHRVDGSKLKQHLNGLRNTYDLILVDAAPAMNEEMHATLNTCDELFIMTTPDYITLSSTMNALKAARERNVRVEGIILNKVHGKHYELNFEEIEDNTKTPIVSILYDDERMLKALAKTMPLAFYKPRSDTATEYKKLAAALIGERYTDRRPVAFLRKLFGRSLTRDEINRAIVMESHY